MVPTISLVMSIGSRFESKTAGTSFGDVSVFARYNLLSAGEVKKLLSMSLACFTLLGLALQIFHRNHTGQGARFPFDSLSYIGFIRPMKFLQSKTSI